MDSIITSSLSLLIVLLLLHFSQTTQASNCSPSACGIIPNISSPFRLKNDPKHCGHREFELACEDNVTSFYYNSHKFYVKDINYDNSSIRLVDASIDSDNICSFPTFSSYHYNFTRGLLLDGVSIGRGDWPRLPVNFMSCPNPLKTYNSSLFTNITHCYPSRNRYVYVKIGHMNASDVLETCMVEVIVMTSWEFKDVNNVSLSEIRDSLVYGFELTVSSWCIDSGSAFPLIYWDRGGSRKINWWGLRFLNFQFRHNSPKIQLVGLLCGMVCPHVMTVFGFAALSLLIYYTVDFIQIAIEEPQYSAVMSTGLVAGALLLYPIPLS